MSTELRVITKVYFLDSESGRILIIYRCDHYLVSYLDEGFRRERDTIHLMLDTQFTVGIRTGAYCKCLAKGFQVWEFLYEIIN